MKKKNKTLFVILYYGGILAVSFLIAANNMRKYNGNALIPETVLNTAIIFLMSIMIGYLAQYFLKKSEKIKPQELRKRILPGFLIFLVSIVVIANLSVVLGVFIWYLVKGLDLSNFVTNVVSYDLAFANKSLRFPLFFFSVLFFFILWGKASKNEIKLLEENFHFKYRVLKSQVNPHFLFNSLNTLSELMHADVQKADFYIKKLSGIYRYILENEEKDLVPLDKELSFLKDYFDLQKMRDDDKIFLHMDVPITNPFHILPVSLQILVENALKHNARSVANPLHIYVSLKDEFVVVTNNIQRKETLEPSTQKGLINLGERVRLILDRDLVIKEENGTFTVKVPTAPAL